MSRPTRLPEWVVRPAGDAHSRLREHFDQILYNRAWGEREKYVFSPHPLHEHLVLCKKKGSDTFYVLDPRPEHQLCTCPYFLKLPEGVSFGSVWIRRRKGSLLTKQEGDSTICIMTENSILVEDARTGKEIVIDSCNGTCKHLILYALLFPSGTPDFSKEAEAA